MTARFAVGDRVRVRAAYPPGHVRTPFYCRGREGTVARYCGDYRNPERLAYGEYDCETQPLYRIRFRQKDLWADYDGGAQDRIDIEIYEHWLEPAGEKP